MEAVRFTEQAAASVEGALKAVTDASALLTHVYPACKPWRLEPEDLAFPPDLLSLEPWDERMDLGTGTWLVAAAVRTLDTVLEGVWQQDAFAASVELLEALRNSPDRTVPGIRSATTQDLFAAHRMARKKAHGVLAVLGRASTYQFRYEDLKSEADRISCLTFHQGAPDQPPPPGEGELGPVAGCLTATHQMLEQMSETFYRLAREGFVQKGPALTYVDSMTGPAPDPADLTWTSPKRIARKLKDITNDLDFQAEGCAAVNTAVIESLKGRPTVPIRRPRTGERWPTSGAKQLYGKEGKTVEGMDALVRHITAKAKTLGDVFHVQMTGRRVPVGHAVTVLRTNRGLMYVDVGVGGGRRKAAGLLEKAKWQDRGFDVFTVTYAGNAADRMDLDSDPET
ncbi:hypothetical protein [Streptomyces sp. NBC_00096]|uniref:hypothetical protein n=1 Tax=Streptomyces sp. NBC_00096 TaxID=2975650 RepID=UPI00324C1FE3